MKRTLIDKTDSLSVKDRKTLQFRLFKEQLDYVWKKSAFYRKKLHDARLTPDAITCPADIRKIPFTTKEELRAHNDDFICVPNRKIVDIGATTGTTGTPIILPATMPDVNKLLGTYRRSFRAIGITADDVVQLSVAFDQLFPIGVTANATLKKIGATVVRMGTGNTRRQIEIMKRVGSTIIFTSPDYMFTLAETAREMGFDPLRDFSLTKGIFHGHPMFDRNNHPTILTKKIVDLWGIECFSCYGSMEMYSGAFDCASHCGYHSHPDWLYLEVIDPATGEVLGDDGEGELVATTLGREAIPLIRYRQGDITRLQTGKCPCGRTSPRIMSIEGRAGNLLKIKGTVVYPQQIEEMLMLEPEISNYAIEARKDRNDCDALRIMVVMQKRSDKVIERIKVNLKARIRITPAIEVLTPQELSKIWYRHGSRKPEKFVDLR